MSLTSNPGSPPLVGGFECEPLAADLGEPDLQVGAGERGAGGVEHQGAVGALVEVHGVPLGPRDRRGVPATRLRSNDPTPRSVPGEPAAGIEPAAVGAPVEIGFARGSSERFTPVTMKPKLPSPSWKSWLPADHGVVGGRLQGGAPGAADLIGDRVERAEGEPAGQPSGHLGGAEDPGEVGEASSP